MACRIKLPNGRFSKLFDDILQDVNGDKGLALQLYASTKTKSFKNAYEGSKDSNGEPLFSSVNFDYGQLTSRASKSMTNEQKNTIKALSKATSKIYYSERQKAHIVNTPTGRKKVLSATEEIQKRYEEFDEPMLKFDLDNFRESTLQNWILKNYPDPTKRQGSEYEQAVEQKRQRIEDDIKTFEAIAEIGTSGHKIIELVIMNPDLNNRNDKERKAALAKLRKLGQKYNKNKAIQRLDNVGMSILLNKGIALRERIYKEYGNENIQILPEQQIYNSKKNVLAISDLLIVREDGSVDIFDYKFSSKDPGAWSDAKSLNVDYQLGLQKNMLESLDIKVGEINVIPVTIEEPNFLAKTASDFTIGGFMNLTRTENFESSSKMMKNIGSYMPSGFKRKFKQSTDTQAMKDFLANYMGMEIKKIENEGVSEEDVKKRYDKIVKVSDYDGKYQFFNKFKRTFERSSSEKEIKEKLKEYMEDELEREQNKPMALIKYIQQKQDAQLDNRQKVGWGARTNNLDRDIRNRLDKALRPYFTDYISTEKKKGPEFVWEPIINDEMVELGIIGMYNTVSNEMDIISISTDSLSKTHDMELGKSIAGNFMKQREEAENAMLKATEGNMQLIKNMLYVMQNKNMFNGAIKLGRVMALSERSQPVIMEAEKLMQNLKVMMDSPLVAGDKNLEIKDMLTDRFDPEIYRQDRLNVFRDYITMLTKRPELDAEIKKSANSLLQEMSADWSNRAQVMMTLQDRFDDLLARQKTHPETLDEFERRELIMLADVILEFNKMNPIHNHEDIGRYSIDNARMLSNPDDIGRNTVEAVVKLHRFANINIRNRFKNEVLDPNRQMFEELFSENLSVMDRNVLGAQHKAYANMYEYERNNEGKWVKSMRLRDPDSNDAGTAEMGQTTLTPTERKVIRKLIEQFKAERIKKIGDGAEFNADTPENRKRWREIPLMRASLFTSLKNKKSAKEATKAYYDNFFKNSALHGDEEYEEKMNKRLTMADRFIYYEMQENREAKLEEDQDRTEFEDNLELIFYSYMVNSKSVEEYNKVLPAINAVYATVALSKEKWFKSLPETYTFLENHIKGTIFGNPLLREEEKEQLKIVSPITKLVETLALGLNPVLGTTQFFTNMWTSISGSVGIHEGKIKRKDFFKGLAFVGAKSLGATMKQVNMLNGMNEMFGIYNMDVSRLTRTIRNDRTGILNFNSRFLHWMNAAPDFFHRMHIFSAEAMSDGVLEVNAGGVVTEDSALQYNEKTGLLEYDEKKDKRFSELFKSNPNTSSEEYQKQKALYEQIKNDLEKEDGKKLKSLPRPYTARQLASKIKRANQLFGDYSDDNQIQWKKTAMGMLMGQFKTWVTSKKNLYWRETRKDEFTGDYIVYQDDNGEWKSGWEGNINEGIFQSLKFTAMDMYNNYKQGDNVLKTFNNLKDYQKRNIKHLASDLTFFAFMWAAASMLLGDDEDRRDARGFIAKMLRNSSKDLFILNVAGSVVNSTNPIPSFSYMSRLMGDISRELGDGDLEGAILYTTKNIGLTRPFYDFYSSDMLKR